MITYSKKEKKIVNMTFYYQPVAKHYTAFHTSDAVYELMEFKT